MELHDISCVGITFTTPRGEHTIVVTAESDCFGCVCVTSAHAITTHIECFKRRFEIFVVAAKETDIGTGHEHESVGAIGVGEWSVGA